MFTLSTRAARWRGHACTNLTPAVIVVIALFVTSCMPNYPPECGRLCRPDFWESASITDVEAELEDGADLNGSKSTGFNSPLHLAIEYNVGAEVIALMLKHGADPNASGHKLIYPILQVNAVESPRTPLQLAIDRHKRPPDNVDIVRLLLEHNADPNPPTDYDSWDDSPLHYAAGQWNALDAAFVALLLEYGADPNAGSSDNETPLHRAAYDGDPAVIALLLEHGADVDARDRYEAIPLHTAAKNPDPGVLELLIGADIITKDSFGDIPLHEAATWNRNPEIFGVLLDHGADVNTKNKNGVTPLHNAADNSGGYPSDLEVVLPLLNHGADVNARDREGNTPLHRRPWTG